MLTIRKSPCPPRTIFDSALRACDVRRHAAFYDHPKKGRSLNPEGLLERLNLVLRSNPKSCFRYQRPSLACNAMSREF